MSSDVYTAGRSVGQDVKRRPGEITRLRKNKQASSETRENTCFAIQLANTSDEGKKLQAGTLVTIAEEILNGEYLVELEVQLENTETQRVLSVSKCPRQTLRLGSRTRECQEFWKRNWIT